MSDYASSPSRPASPVGELPSFTASRSYRFNWDNKRPGPGSVSETTEGRGDYFTGNAPYDVYNNASLTSLGTLPAEWSSSKHGFNGASHIRYRAVLYLMPCSYLECREQSPQEVRTA